MRLFCDTGTERWYSPDMAQETIKHVHELMDSVQMDNTHWMEKLWALTNELRARVDERFPNLQRDPSSAGYDSYGGGPGQPNGRATTWVGDDIDWLVHSHTGNPSMGFSNMHLTLWLGPHTPVPHLAFAFGTMPEMFCLIEYNPRCDLALNPDELHKYYLPMNDQWLELRVVPRLD